MRRPISFILAGSALTAGLAFAFTPAERADAVIGPSPCQMAALGYIYCSGTENYALMYEYGALFETMGCGEI